MRVNCTTVWLCYDGVVSKLSAVPHPLPEPLIELVAQRFRVLQQVSDDVTDAGGVRNRHVPKAGDGHFR